jgi:hypothetical protein
VDNPAVRNSLAYPQAPRRLATPIPPVENNLSILARIRPCLGCLNLSTEIGFTIHIHFNSLLKPSDLLILFAWSPVSGCWLEIDLSPGFL